ncbi:MAG TPA: beta-N-acetylhexosaminidase [Saprospiraceae bacterium]|nr:beta-N-acetylhexosaminidase [Saprospiraceae bacterium]
MNSNIPKVSVLVMSLLIVMGCSGLSSSQTETIEGNLAIAPLPSAMEAGTGFFLINEKVKILTNTKNFPHFDPFKVFNEVFEKKSGYALSFLHDKAALKDSSQLIKVSFVFNTSNPEAYSLRVKSSGILITAGSELGVFYAFQTLRQIMRLDAVPDAKGSQRSWSVPYVDITDEPRFSYRGMHLDVSRHFFPVEFVKKYIDLLAYYKMNYFHWHLTDDQGWRVEIKKYPKLQEIAAYRDETLIGRFGEKPPRYDSTRYGGYYTQDQIKDVVKYASDRAVTIVPEIEMPGHSLAALAAYPELACTSGPFKVATTWGVFNDVYCPEDSTFAFLENVLDEVLTLFPSKYVHIGGDECPKTRWGQSQFCQNLMKDEGLKTANELQSYFIQRIEKYLNSKGKTVIGWDEILEGGIAPNATVMSWRGIKGGIEAAKAGHNVVMTPGDYCYFDHYQGDRATEPLAIGGFTSVEKVYSFDPVPAELSETEAKHILGAQGNVWTEYIDTPEKAEYMAYPRAVALSEVLWTRSSRRDWKEFSPRLAKHLERLDGLNVNYAGKPGK